jgi:hypothetical protein
MFVDKPLTVAQRSKLKGIAFIEDIKAPFKPSLLISGDPAQVASIQKTGLTQNQAQQVTNVLRASGNAGAARSFQSAARYALLSVPTYTVASGTVNYRNPVTGTVVQDRVVLRASGSPTTPIQRTAPTTRRDSVILQYQPSLTRVNSQELQRSESIRSVDTRTPERRGTEARSTDTRIPDNRIVEPRITEPRVTEVRTIERRIPETRTPETRSQEVRVPDTRYPEERILEQRIPEVRVPETRTVETRVPEVRFPETRAPETRIPEVRVPTIREPEMRTPKLPPVLTRMSSSRTSQHIPDGSVVWAMGEMLQGRGKGRVLSPVWKYIPPEDFGTGAKPRTLYAPPIGATNTGSRTPRDTIQVIGDGSGIPDGISVDLGWTDITIHRGSEISFTGGGRKTNIGTRMNSNTQGMSIDEAGMDYSGTPTSSGINRTKMGKKRPNRVKRSQDDFSSITSLKGLKL